MPQCWSISLSFIEQKDAQPSTLLSPGTSDVHSTAGGDGDGGGGGGGGGGRGGSGGGGRHGVHAWHLHHRAQSLGLQNAAHCGALESLGTGGCRVHGLTKGAEGVEVLGCLGLLAALPTEDLGLEG